MVVDSEHYTERAFAQLLNHFIPVAKVLIVTYHILLLVRVKAVVRCVIDFAVARSPRQCLIVVVLYPLVDVEEVNGIILIDLPLLVLPEVGA